MYKESDSVHAIRFLFCNFFIKDGDNMNLREQYKYKIELTYVNDTNVSVEIDSDQIQHILIDKDYDNLNFPVITVFGSIEKNILDDMIRHANDNIVTLGIYKYDSTNQFDNITDKYFNDRFIYIINEDVSRTEKLDNPEGIDSKTGNKQYKEVTIFLIQQNAVNNNRQVINGVFKNASTNTLILNTTNYIGKLLLEPVTYDTKYEQVLIPPIDSISNYINYLNSQLGVFYDTSYRFFIDFDSAYLVSSSGNPIRAKDQYIYTIIIDIQEVDVNIEEEPGAYVDTRSGTYTIGIDASKVEYTKNYITNKMVNQLTVINSKGDVFKQDIKENVQNKNTTQMNQVVSVSNNDQNSINNLSYDIESSNVTISMVKNDLDASIFTINKEYIINDSVHDIRNQRYILAQTKQLFIKQDDNFIMSTVLTFKPAMRRR